MVTSSRRSGTNVIWYGVRRSAIESISSVKRHLEIEHRANRLCERDDVVVLHVTAVLAQMRGDPLGARVFTERGGGNGIRLVGAPRLAQRGDMVDVYVEALVSCWHVYA